MAGGEQLRGYVLGPGEGVEGDAALKASRASTGSSLTLMESRTRGGAPWHVHSREDECFYVLEGTLTVHCGTETFTAGPRAFVFLPRGVPHAWDVDGDEATVLIITVPGGFEAFLRDLHAAERPLSDEAADRIAAQHGLAWIRQTPPNEA